MLKTYLSGQGMSVYSISKCSGISYSTLNDIVNHKVEIANVKAGILHTLANTLEISMDSLYELCRDNIIVQSKKYHVNGFVGKKNKKYYLRLSSKSETTGTVLFGRLLSGTSTPLKGRDRYIKVASFSAYTWIRIKSRYDWIMYHMPSSPKKISASLV